MKGIRGFFFIIFILILSLSSCFSGFFPQNDEEKIDGIERAHSTRVQFSNINAFKISVFINGNRDLSTQIGYDVPAYTTSEFVECAPSSLFSFYLRYYLNISDVEIPYNPPFGKGGLVTYPVPRNKETTVPIPSLFNPSFNIDLDELLVTDSYYFSIKNTSLSTFNLLIGNIPQTSTDGIEYIINDQTAVYRFTSTNLSNIKLVANLVNEFSFPLATVERGKVYSLEFTGYSILHHKTVDITLRNSVD